MTFCLYENVINVNAQLTKCTCSYEFGSTDIYITYKVITAFSTAEFCLFSFIPNTPNVASLCAWFHLAGSCVLKSFSGLVI